MRFFWACLVTATVGCGGADARVSTEIGDRAVGVFGDDNGFFVALAEVHSDGEELVLQQHGPTGALVARTVLRPRQATPFGRAMMKRLATGETLVSSAHDGQLHFVSSDGATVTTKTAPASALSRVKEAADWLVAGIGVDGTLHRYRVTAMGQLTDDLAATEVVAAGETIVDARATGDGGIAIATTGHVTKYDESGALVWQITGYGPGPIGRLLQQNDGQVRFVSGGHMGYVGIAIVDTAGQASSFATVQAPTAGTWVWPGDDGSFVWAAGAMAELIDPTGTRTWTTLTSSSSSPNYGVEPAIFSNPTKTWIAATTQTGATGTQNEVTVHLLDNVDGHALGAFAVSAGKTY